MTSPARAPQILFPTDFSETAEEALRVAAEYARRLGGRLHVLHVVVPGADWLAQPRVEQLTRGIEPAVPVVTTVAYGLPASAIVRYAEEHAIDLIVVGTHGRTGISRALIGSVAERIVRTAPCPVLTVPRRWRPGEHAMSEETEPAPRGCVVCANPSEDLICAGCRARIRGEAIERKQKEERAGRP